MEGKGRRGRRNKIILKPINNNKQNNIVRTFETKYGDIQITQSEIDFVESDDFEISLPNVGSTCFMNTCLNSFLSDKELFLFCVKIYSHIKKDKKFNDDQLIEDIQEYNRDNPKMIAFKPPELQDRIPPYLFKNFCELCYVLYHINKDKGAGFNSEKTTEVLKKIANTIRTDRPDIFGADNGADAKDTYLHFAENFQKVFKIMTKEQAVKTSSNDVKQYNPLETYLGMLQELMTDGNFNKNNPLQHFYGSTELNMTCFKCNNCSYNYQTKNFSIFPLDNCAEYYQKNINFSIYTNNIPLEVCFLDEAKTELMTGSNQIFCNNTNCRSSQNALNSSIYSFPPEEHKMIILNRGKGNIVNVDTYIPEAYCANEAYGIYYELEYVGIHIAGANNYNHFVSNIKKKDKNGNDIWCTVNDGIYTKAPHKGKGRPYLLKYKKISKERFEQICQQNANDKYREKKRHPYICDPVVFQQNTQNQIYSKYYLYQKYIFEHKEELLSNNDFLNLSEEGKKKYLYDRMTQQEKDYLRDKIKNAPADKNININSQNKNVNNINSQLNKNNYQNSNYPNNNNGSNQNQLTFEQFCWFFHNKMNNNNNGFYNNNYLNNINNGFKINNNFLNNNNYLNNINNGFKINNNFLNNNNYLNNLNNNNNVILPNIKYNNNINSNQNNKNIKITNNLPNININKTNNINAEQNVKPKILPIIVNNTKVELTNDNNKKDNTKEENKNKINNGTTNQKKKKKIMKLKILDNDTTKKVESTNDKNQNNKDTNNINVFPNINISNNLNNKNINNKIIKNNDNNKKYNKDEIPNKNKNKKKIKLKFLNNDNTNNKIIKNNDNKHEMFNKKRKPIKFNNIFNKVDKKTNYNLNDFLSKQNIKK